MSAVAVVPQLLTSSDLVASEPARSTRGGIGGLVTARPMSMLLPAIYQEDDFTTRWVAAFDDVVNPLVAVLDCIEAYLDPALAPVDFVQWLGTWVGALFDDAQPLDQQRSLVADLVALHGLRGTVSGIVGLLEKSLPVTCEVIEGGGTVASVVPGAALPGSDVGVFVVRVRPTERPLTEHEQRRAALLVDASRPAHLPGTVEFLEFVEPAGASEKPS
jgi:phage tail-like protein